jgi:branched-chain amino acid transport system ATP-binding protein
VTAPLLQIDHVSKRFGGLQALDDVSMAIESGEIVGIIGPNGAGKTTLFNVASGFVVPDSGSVMLDGRRVDGSRPHRLCRLGLARTFQVTKPFHNLTVLEAVRIGALNHTDSMSHATKLAREVLARVRLDDRADQLSRQLTVIQRKRLEIARALATGPRIILLDEVAAGLRGFEIRELVELIRAIAAEGIAVVMIEHVLEALMATVARVVVLNFGCKIAEGTPLAVARDDRVIEAYLGTEASHA